jgi:hypothetical protein
MSSSAPPVVQDPSAAAPRVINHDRTNITKGFNCGLSRPATDGSLVYLLARKKHQFIMAIGTYAFWVFVYDWKARRGFRIPLPEVFPPPIFTVYTMPSDLSNLQGNTWLKIAGSGHTVILQDWRDMMYTLDLSAEFSVPFPPSAIQEDEDPSLLWRLVSEGRGATLVHIPFRHQEEANLMPNFAGNISHMAGESFCLISRLGERISCHFFRRLPPSSSKGPLEPPLTPYPGFTHVGTGYVDIGGGQEQLGTPLLYQTRGTRCLLGYPADDGTEGTVHLSVVDFEVDCNQDGTDGLQSIRGRKRELLVGGEMQGPSSSSGPGSKTKGLRHILGRGNAQEVFYDGFRGTIGMMNKEYSEIVLFRTIQD